MRVLKCMIGSDIRWGMWASDRLKAAAPPSPSQNSGSISLFSSFTPLTLPSYLAQNKLGGGEGVEGLYGSINCAGMTRVLSSFSLHCGMDASSTLVDVGAGLGRPLLHAVLSHGLCGARGVEIDAIKVAKAKAFLSLTARQLVAKGVIAKDRFLENASLPSVECAAIEDVASLTDCTHAYSFWEGVPPSGKEAFGRLVTASPNIRGLAVVQRAVRHGDPAEHMAALGFETLKLVETFLVSMSGSGQRFTAYVFVRGDERAAVAEPVLPAAQPAQASTVGAPASPQASLDLVPTPPRSREGHPVAARSRSSDACPLPPPAAARVESHALASTARPEPPATRGASTRARARAQASVTEAFTPRELQRAAEKRNRVAIRVARKASGGAAVAAPAKEQEAVREDDSEAVAARKRPSPTKIKPGATSGGGFPLCLFRVLPVGVRLTDTLRHASRPDISSEKEQRGECRP